MKRLVVIQDEEAGRIKDVASRIRALGLGLENDGMKRDAEFLKDLAIRVITSPRAEESA